MLLDLELARVEILDFEGPRDQTFFKVPLPREELPCRDEKRVLVRLLEARLQREQRWILLEVTNGAADRGLALAQLGCRLRRRALECVLGVRELTHQPCAVAEGKLDGNVHGRRELADGAVYLVAVVRMMQIKHVCVGGLDMSADMLYT